jgi:Undecaprenyl-phosphate glucose phosphotransferase
VLLERLHLVQSGQAFGQSDDAKLSTAHYIRIRLHGWMAALMCADVVGAVVLSLIIFNIYAEPLNYARTQLWAGLGGFVVAWGLAAHSQGLYERTTTLSGRRILLLKAIATCAISFGLLMLLAFGLKFIGSVSRLWLLASGASTCLWVMVVRLAFRQRLETMLRSGYCLDRALILCGAMPIGNRARDTIERESRGQIRVTVIAPIPGLQGAPALGFIESAIRSGSIDRVFVAGFDGHADETNLLLSRLAQLAVDVTLLPNFQGVRAPSLRAARIGMLPAVDVACRPLTHVQSFMKRAEDLVLGSIILLLAGPVMLLIALGIKLDSRGPVFYRQTRLGFHDKAFRVWKFRTMRPNADSGPVLRQTSRDDDRVTRLGRILRRTSLDELPQLFNVISGEMSIVGPRPHAETMTTAGLPLHAVLDVYASRHRIKPGITGWAQVNGCRGEVTTEAKLRERVTLDCYYIENWSIAIDAWIIFRTIGLALFDKDAY